LGEVSFWNMALGFPHKEDVEDVEGWRESSAVGLGPWDFV